MKINADYIVRKDYFFYVTFCKMENLLNNTDYLSHQPYLELLKSIISNQKDNPTGYSFAIDGEWGSGKTWILQELEKQLLEEKDNKYLIFHYNAWENDFYDEPLVAILSVMIECLKKQKSLILQIKCI